MVFACTVLAPTVVKLLADIIEKYSKRNVSRDSAQEAATRIVNAVDESIEDIDIPVDDVLTTANPEFSEFIQTSTRALLDEKHSPIPDELLGMVKEGGEDFSRLRGYTDEEFQVFQRSFVIICFVDGIIVRVGYLSNISHFVNALLYFCKITFLLCSIVCRLFQLKF